MMVEDVGGRGGCVMVVTVGDCVVIDIGVCV